MGAKTRKRVQSKLMASVGVFALGFASIGASAAYRGQPDPAPRPVAMEAYLAALEAQAQGQPESVATLAARVRVLHDQFDERMAYWKAHPAAGQPGRELFAVIEGSLLPALAASDAPRARAALAQVATKYQEHAQAIAAVGEGGRAGAGWVFWLGGVATVLLALAAAVLLGRRFARPVREADEAMDQLEGTALGVQAHASKLVAESESLAQVSRAMTHSVGDSVTKADTMAANAAGVSRSVQSLAGAVDQLQQCIGEISRSATQAAQVAGSAVAVADHARTTVMCLEQSSDEIGGITKLITSIAEQTNLLALNATIEAARAGDAGKGFAVVAGEVKELARATAGATENISTKVDAIRRDIRDTASAILKIGSTIQEIAAYQTTIASAVEQQTATTKDIGGTLADAAVGAQEMAASIENVAEASRSTARGVQSTGQAAQALARLAADMQALVANLDVRKASGTVATVRDGEGAAAGSGGGTLVSPPTPALDLSARMVSSRFLGNGNGNGHGHKNGSARRS